MNRTSFITISSEVSLAYGAGALILPAALTSVYGVGLDRAGLFLVQFLGASYIGTRSSAGSPARAPIRPRVVASRSATPSPGRSASLSRRWA